MSGVRYGWYWFGLLILYKCDVYDLRILSLGYIVMLDFLDWYKYLIGFRGEVYGFFFVGVMFLFWVILK